MHPINFGEFSGHELDSVASKAKDHESLKMILIEDANDNELFIRAKRYHAKIYPKVEAVVRSLIELGEGNSAN